MSGPDSVCHLPDCDETVSARQRYCSRAHKMRAYRRRKRAGTVVSPDERKRLKARAKAERLRDEAEYWERSARQAEARARQLRRKATTQDLIATGHIELSR